MRRLLAYAVPVAGVIGLACSGGAGGGDDWSGEIRDSAGVTIVENTGGGLWEAGSGWRIEEVLRIGSSEADPEFTAMDPEYQFGQISGIAVSAGGEIFVLDQQAQQVRVFDGQGEFLRSMGQPGGGPGELGQGAGPVLMAAGDTVVVPDMANQRVTLFAAGGEYLSSWPIQFEAGIPIRWETTNRGLVVNQVRPLAQATAADSMDAIVARGADGAVIDTVRSMPSGKTFSFGGGGPPEFNFFAPEPAWAVYPGDRILFGINDQYSIGLYGSDGSFLRSIRRPTSRQSVGQADQDAFMQAIERAWQEAGVPPQALQQLRSGVHFADQYPAFLQFLTGPDGSIWVQHVADVANMGDEELRNFNPLLSLGGSRWDVFDGEGRFLGPIDMPTRFQPVRFQDDRIYGIWRDELDVQHVLVLRVVPV